MFLKTLSKGAASEGDAHAAFNFSATLECPGKKDWAHYWMTWDYAAMGSFSDFVASFSKGF